MKKPDIAPIKKRALTINEFCAEYNCSRASAYRMIKAGKLHATMIMGKRLIPYDSAEALLLIPVPLQEKNRNSKHRHYETKFSLDANSTKLLRPKDNAKSARLTETSSSALPKS